MLAIIGLIVFIICLPLIVALFSALVPVFLVIGMLGTLVGFAILSHLPI